MSILGAEIDAGTNVNLRLTNGSTAVELGEATAGPDGTFLASGVVPASFPIGYAELTAAADDLVWSTFVLIGERPEGPGGVSSGPPLDDQLVWLGILGIGLVVFVVAVVRFRRGQRGTSLGA